MPGELPYDDLRRRRRAPAAAAGRGDPERLAVLLYTSGTSGRPRAAMLSHRALLANIEQAAAVEPPMITGDDVVLGVLPLFHVYGLNAVLGQVLRQRARLVLVDGFDTEGSLDVIEDEAVTRAAGRAAGVRLLAGRAATSRERLGPVRLVLSGSAPLSAELVDAFTARTGHRRCTRATGSPRRRRWSPRTLCSAHAEAGLGRAPPCPASRSGWSTRPAARPRARTPGEIQIRGANLFSGYWPDGADGPDADGWYATGDVGFLDADGDLFLVDRLKELVIVSGFNVYPVEVEDVIAEVDGVAEAAVIGVAGRRAPARRWSPTSSRRPGRRTPRRARGAWSASTARSGWPGSSSRPRSHVVDELPHTVTGKVAKGRLRGQPSAAGRWGCSSDVTRPGHALLQARLPPVRRRPRGRRAGLRRAGRDVRRGRHHRRPDAELLSARTARRSRSPSSTAASTTSGGSTRPGCGAALGCGCDRDPVGRVRDPADGDAGHMC